MVNFGEIGRYQRQTNFKISLKPFASDFMTAYVRKIRDDFQRSQNNRAISSTEFVLYWSAFSYDSLALLFVLILLPIFGKLIQRKVHNLNWANWKDKWILSWKFSFQKHVWPKYGRSQCEKLYSLWNHSHKTIVFHFLQYSVNKYVWENMLCILCHDNPSMQRKDHEYLKKKKKNL